MNILSKVTRKTLVKNRVRTLVTIAGIILSAAMITAVTTSAVSIIRYIQDMFRAERGDWHGQFISMPAEDIERLESDSRVDSVAYAQALGYYYSEESEDIYDNLYVIGGDETFFERMPVNITAGRLPENPGEILLHQIMLGDLETNLGDTIELPLGERYYEGQRLTASDRYIEGEELRITGTRTYTVVGYYSYAPYEFYQTPADYALTVWDESAETPTVEAYFLLKKPAQIYEFIEEFPEGAFGATTNSSYLSVLGVSAYSTLNQVIYGFAAILIGLIMFGSVSLIYNAFSISVAERTKQFGLLRSIGATKRQIRSMVFTEAFSVSAVGIPLGILSGILGMAVTFHFIGRELASFLSGSFIDQVALTLRPNLWAILAAAGIGLVTVLISAWIPSRRAMRVSAIEAIRQSGDVSIKKREVRTSKLTYKLFGLEGAIASKHFKRNRKGYRATVVSLFMSVVLFISASSFCRYLTDSVREVYLNYDYDIRYYLASSAQESGKTLEDAVETLRDAAGIKEWSAMGNTGTFGIFLQPGEVTAEYLRYIPEENQEYVEEYGNYETIYLIGVEEETYQRYLKEQGLSESEYMGEEPKALVHSVLEFFNTDTQRFEKVQVFRDGLESLTLTVTDIDRLHEFYRRDDLDEMSEEEYNELLAACDTDVTFTLGREVDELPLGLNGGADSAYIYLLLPLETVEKLNCGYTPYMYFTADNSQEATANLVALAEEAGLPGEGWFYDVYASNRSARSIIKVVQVVSYGFITLISLIAALNVFNTISTNILLRRREFAMLRSVGMTNRGFNKMMNFECILYGTKSLIYGIPVAFGVTYLIFRTVQNAMDTGFYLPWSAVAIAVGSVFLVVFATMLYSMSGIKRDNPIEAMKSEIT